ncbi:O-antigen ligase family protein [Candidatus Peregrinibacteria bacterium]|nr:O-antigen ligase family protein [Candidatus Peregrinibacteria bacterium]
MSLSDIFLLIAAVFFGISLIFNRNKKWHFGSKKILIIALVFFIMIELQGLFESEQKHTLQALLRMLEYLIMYFMIVNEVLTMERIKKYWIITFSMQAFIAVLQSIFQHSVNLSPLGEPSIGANISGVAKIGLEQIKFIRSYGTLPHPNILGGLLVLSLFFTAFFWKNEKMRRNIIIIQSLGLLTTFSRSAMVGYLGSIMFLWIALKPQLAVKKKLMELLKFGSIAVIIFILMQTKAFYALKERALPQLNDKALTERSEYLKISARMIEKFPLFGIGIGNFTTRMQDFTKKKLAPWEHQPVHNVFALVASETGLIGFAFFLFAMMLIFQKIYRENKKFSNRDSKENVYLLYLCVFAVIIIMFFDHYWITLYQGQIALVIIIAFVSTSTEKKEKMQIRKLQNFR